MQYLNGALLQIMSIVIAGGCGWLAAQVKRLSARDKALYDGMKTLLMSQIVQYFETYVQDGNNHTLTIERKREIDDCFAAYAALGGNGTGKQMYEKLCNVKIEIIK